MNIARFFFHGVLELTSSKNRVIADSPTYTEKRHVIELSTTVNDSSLVIDRIVPHYISWVRDISLWDQIRFYGFVVKRGDRGRWEVIHLYSKGAQQRMVPRPARVRSWMEWYLSANKVGTWSFWRKMWMALMSTKLLRLGKNTRP